MAHVGPKHAEKYNNYYKNNIYNYINVILKKYSINGILKKYSKCTYMDF